MLFVTESSLVSVLCVLTFTSRSLAASCYWRDGTPATLNRQNYTACDNTTTSMCCLLSGGDACTTLGLCISASGSLFRSACTDPTWKSSQCISMCPDTNTNAQVIFCSDGSLCCAGDTECCQQGNGAIVNDNGTLSYPPESTTFSNSNAWKFLTTNAWLATPIIAAIGWINTWVIAAMLTKGDYAFVADRRYAGLAKRTVLPAFLANHETARPNKVVGCVAMDPGESSQLDDLYPCSASALSYISWLVQLCATLYAVGLGFYVWAQDSHLKTESAWIQFPLLLGALNVNRGTWALAAVGSFIPPRRFLLIITTIIAVMLDAVFIARAFILAWYVNNMNVLKVVGVAAWLFPSLEGSVFVAGLIAGMLKVHYIGPEWFIFLPGGMWLVVGPLIIAIVAILSHFHSD